MIHDAELPKLSDQQHQVRRAVEPMRVDEHVAADGRTVYLLVRPGALDVRLDGMVLAVYREGLVQRWRFGTSWQYDHEAAQVEFVRVVGDGLLGARGEFDTTDWLPAAPAADRVIRTPDDHAWRFESSYNDEIPPAVEWALDVVYGEPTFKGTAPTGARHGS